MHWHACKTISRLEYKRAAGGQVNVGHILISSGDWHRHIPRLMNVQNEYRLPQCKQICWYTYYCRNSVATVSHAVLWCIWFCRRFFAEITMNKLSRCRELKKRRAFIMHASSTHTHTQTNSRSSVMQSTSSGASATRYNNNWNHQVLADEQFTFTTRDDVKQ